MPYFDRFDIVEAWHLWLSENVDGMHGNNYRRLCKLSQSYTPRPSLYGRDDLTGNGKAIYDEITG